MLVLLVLLVLVLVLVLRPRWLRQQGVSLAAHKSARRRRRIRLLVDSS
jgi:hypothetical protein